MLTLEERFGKFFLDFITALKIMTVFFCGGGVRGVEVVFVSLSNPLTLGLCKYYDTTGL